jgi:hypothetical protein
VPGSRAVEVSFGGDADYLASSAAAALDVAGTEGKVTAGVLRTPGGGRGGFNVQSDGERIWGELQFKSGGVSFHAHELTALAVAPDFESAWFAGIGKDGRTFVAYVEDDGEPGRHDVFRLWIDDELQTGDGRLSGGNVQIHRSCSPEGDGHGRSRRRGGKRHSGGKRHRR